MLGKKRVNKTKEELVQEAAHKAQIDREKSLAHRMWPHILDSLSIYDAQTALNAASGFIKYEVAAKEAQLKVSDVPVDLTNQTEGPIKTAVARLLEECADVNAKDAAGLMERFATQLGRYSASEFMKKPMHELKEEDIIA